MKNSFYSHVIPFLYGGGEEDSAEVMWFISNLTDSRAFELINTIRVFGLWPFVSWAMKKRHNKLQQQSLWVLDRLQYSPQKTRIMPYVTKFDFFECLKNILAPNSTSDEDSKEFARNILEETLNFFEEELNKDDNNKIVEIYRSTVDVIYDFAKDMEVLSSEFRDLCLTLKALCESTNS